MAEKYCTEVTGLKVIKGSVQDIHNIKELLQLEDLTTRSTSRSKKGHEMGDTHALLKKYSKNHTFNVLSLYYYYYYYDSSTQKKLFFASLKFKVSFILLPYFIAPHLYQNRFQNTIRTQNYIHLSDPVAVNKL